jgi:hypothetical protein
MCLEVIWFNGLRMGHTTLDIYFNFLGLWRSKGTLSNTNNPIFYWMADCVDTSHSTIFYVPFIQYSSLSDQWEPMKSPSWPTRMLNVLLWSVGLALGVIGARLISLSLNSSGKWRKLPVLIWWNSRTTSRRIKASATPPTIGQRLVSIRERLVSTLAIIQ